jgi:uncharacterized protein (DUF433 family)
VKVASIPNTSSDRLRAWLFVGTRVPVEALFKNLEGGVTVAEFLERFPGATREQVEAVPELARRRGWPGSDETMRIPVDQGTPVAQRRVS